MYGFALQITNDSPVELELEVELIGPQIIPAANSS